MMGVVNISAQKLSRLMNLKALCMNTAPVLCIDKNGAIVCKRPNIVFAGVVILFCIYRRRRHEPFVLLSLFNVFSNQNIDFDI
jgi:hypothetical protein